MMGAEFEILYWIQSLRSPWLDGFMRAVTSLGDGGIFWILLGGVLLCFKKTRRVGVCLLVSLGIGYLTGNLLLKNLIGRSRPCWVDSGVTLLIESPKDYSFPSGHTLASFEGAVSVWLFNWKWGNWLLVLAVLVAVSRLYLFVHFPSDVLGGMGLGILIAWGVNRGPDLKK